MAVYEVWLKSDLKKPLTVTALQGVFFTGDNDAYKIGVQVTDNGSAASLSGTVTGYIVRADGGTLSVSGTLSGSTAYILLPAAALNMEGPIDITVKLTTNSVVTTLGACRGYVQRATTDTLIDSGTVITVVGSVNGVHPDANGNVTLSAGDITTGTLPASQVPNISAAKITSGTIGAARLPNMVGATASNNGTKGAVPAPSAGDQDKLLKGDGTWTSAYAVVQTLANGSDADNVKTPGLYYCSSTTSNLPNSATNGHLIVIGTGSNVVKQIFSRQGNIGTNDYQAYLRTYSSGTWGSWYAIITEKGGTITGELSVGSNNWNGIYLPGGSSAPQVKISNTGTRLLIDQYSSHSASYGERYRMPNVTAVSGDVYYDVLTTKPGAGYIYGNGDTYATDASYVAPLVGYVGAEGKVIYFTVPVSGDMSSVSSISVTRLSGAIRTCESKFIAGKSSSSYDWTSHSGLTITAQKVAPNLARILMTFTTAPTNATENAVVCGVFMVTLSFSVS